MHPHTRMYGRDIASLTKKQQHKLLHITRAAKKVKPASERAVVWMLPILLQKSIQWGRVNGSKVRPSDQYIGQTITMCNSLVGTGSGGEGQEKGRKMGRTRSIQGVVSVSLSITILSDFMSYSTSPSFTKICGNVWLRINFFFKSKLCPFCVNKGGWTSYKLY